MIKKIKLLNWKTHKNSELEFSNGTNVIVGINGAGKSSIMDAISFGLFGTFPKLLSRKQKLDDLITNKPEKFNEARVKLEFFYDGKEYSVLRVLERGKGTTHSEIRLKEKDKEILIEGFSSQRVTDEIKKILKIDYELFSRAIYSEQNGIDYFIELSPGDRAKKIDNLLKIDDFEKARSNVVTLKTKFEGEKVALQNSFSEENIKNKEIEIQELEKKISNDDNEIKIKYREANDLKIGVLELQKKVDELEKKIMEIKKLEEKIFFLKRDLEEKKNNYEKIKNLLGEENSDSLSKKISNLNDQIKKLEEEYHEKNKTYEKILTEKTKIEAECNSLIKRNVEIEKKTEKLEHYKMIYEDLSKKYNANIDQFIEEKKKILNEINSKISVLEYKRRENENIFLQIEKLQNKCPICGSEINTDKKKHLLHLKQEESQDLLSQIEFNSNEKKILELTIKKLEGDLEDFKEAKKYIEELSILEEEYENNKKTIDKNRNILSDLELNIKKVKDDVYYIKDKLEEAKMTKIKFQNMIEKINELSDLENRIEKINKDLEFSTKLKNEIENYVKKENYDNIKIKFESIKSKLTEAMTIISEKEKILYERRSLLDKNLKDLEFLKEQKNYILRLEKILKNLGIFELALRITQEQLREEFIETVNRKMSELWLDLYPYNDYNDIRLFVEEGSYNLQLLNKSGEWINVENVSGGESTMACLALKIAFSLVLVPHLNWIILDEPTHNLDEKSVSSLNEVFRDRIKNFVSQIFIITHDKHLENAASGELYRINRNKDEDGYSEIIKVTEI